jgi:hypothetical protein
MPGSQVPLVLFPRYTGLSGATKFKTAALDVNDYGNAAVSVWRGKLLAGSTGFSSTCEESTDQVNWTVCGGTTAGFDPGEETEGQVVAHLRKRWFRLVLELGGTNPGVTCWAVGALERR